MQTENSAALQSTAADLQLFRLGRISRFTSRRITGGLGGEAKFAEVLLGERGLGITNSFQVLGLDFLVDFTPVNRYCFRSFDADTDIVSIYTLDDKNNVVSDLNRFVDFAGKCKHLLGLSVDA